MERSDRVKITLKWIQILDKLEPFYKERGEFRFKARVSTPDGRVLSETTLPKEGHLEISDRPGWNRVTLDEVVFEGQPGAEGLVVEFTGEELDTLSANDRLDHYRREFTGPASSWVGWYGPGDETQVRPEDPENMSKWRVCYTIEQV
ncbi:MAG: hypothetical protein DIU52_012295 [bacterium]|jgi:hypothetical protein|nr:MAG: hypothetical protein DIU52_11020 [bacterium]